MVDDAPDGAAPPREPAVGDADPDPAEVAAVLDGISGVHDRVRIAREQLARGEGIPLEEL